MTKPRTIYTITFILIALILLLTAGYYLFFKRILADSIYGPEVSQIAKQIDLNNDGTNEALILSNHRKNSENRFFLDYKTKRENSRLELTGFESSASFCSDPTPKINSQTRIICLTDFVGAHSQNIELVNLINNQLAAINFLKEGSKSINIYSDAPNFGFKDLNRDGNLVFYLDDRNYDLDPTLDSWRSYYYFKDGEFIFDHAVSLKGGVEALDQQGKIN